MMQYIKHLLTVVINFVFFGSKSILSSKNKPFVCCVREICVKEYNITGRLFFPTKRSLLYPTTNVPWFKESVSDIIRGKLAYLVPGETRSLLVDNILILCILLAKLIPKSCYPRIPNTCTDGELIKDPLPLIIWSHGRGGNYHDQSLMLAQLAVEVPAIVVALTHTDGSADTWKDSRGNSCFFSESKRSGPVSDDRYIQELIEWKEYQIKYRITEIERIVDFVKNSHNIKFTKVFVGGFDIGGATALSIASLPLANGTSDRICVSGAISLDGLLSIDGKSRFPKSVFDRPGPISVPVAYIQSDEWNTWNTVSTEITRQLAEKTLFHKSITVKQTTHNNFIEVPFWIPQIFLPFLRMSGFIHRRGSPRKSYRRTCKWLISLVQQYVLIEGNQHETIDTNPSLIT
jgi:predicted esterase